MNLGVDGKPQRATAVGDVPNDAVDSRGTVQRLILRNVRMWEATSTECMFGGNRAMFSPPGPYGQRLSLSFGRIGGLYVWRVF
eukprot:3439380-Pleurochrysis_carterae.AAC.4